MSPRFELVWVIFFSFWVFFLSAQEIPYWQLTDEEGLPGNTIYYILQDDDGYIWAGTNVGLCRYDGRNFTIFNHPNLDDKEILHIQKDFNNRIWFHNLSGDFGYVENEQVVLVDSIGNQEVGIVKMFVWTQNDLWIGANEKASNINFLQKFSFDSSFQLIDQKKWDNEGVYFIESYKDGVSFMSKVTGQPNLLKTGDSSINIIDFPNILPQTRKIFQVYPAVQKVNYVSESAKKFRFFNEQKKVVHEHQLSHRISNIFYFDDRYLFLCNAAGGFFKYDLVDYSYQFFLEKFTVNYLLKDKEGNFWIGTEEEGLLVAPNLKAKHFTPENSELPMEKIYSMTKDEATGQIVIGFEKGGFSVVKNQTFENHILEEDRRIMDICPVGNGYYLLGGDRGYLYRFPIDLPFPINSNFGSIKSIFKASTGDIWIGASNTTFKINKEELFQPRTANTVRRKILQQRTYAVCEDKNGLIWIGTYRGLYTYDGEKTDPFLEDNVHVPYRVSSMNVDSKGNIWVGTHGEGLLKISTDYSVKKYKTEQGALSNTCNVVRIDEDDKIYVGTDNGVQILDSNKNNWSFFNKFDGLPTKEVSAIFPNKEDLWIGTPKGLVTVPYPEIKSNQIPPPIYINSIEINGEKLPLSDSYKLHHTKNNLAIHFTGLALSAQSNEQYQYRLTGLDTNWVVSNNRVARFHGLHPGDYHFEVIAISEDNVKSDNSANIHFKIITPWWRTLWFKILAFLSVVSTISGIVYIRQREARARERLENKLQEKIRFLEMEALQKQMNPHFIYNSLNAIQDFFLTNNSKSALFFLSKFAKMIRFIFELSRQKTITLEQELEFLNLYLEMEKLRFEDKVKIDLEIAPEILQRTEDIELPPLLLQPIVENVFKHGLMHKLEGGELKIKFENADNDFIKCIIADNGIGRAKSAELKKQNHWRKGRKRTTSGLKATKDRLKLFHQLNGRSPANYLIINDLVDSYGEPSGTEVILTL
jgi:ligand-binding sensor domain-containing protein